MSAPVAPEVLAAVDLGSNSFHLVIARVVGSGPNLGTVVIDKMKDRVQLAAGLDAQMNLTEEVQGRALECLARFRERLRDHPPDAVRAIGTNTLRRARNAPAFLVRAVQAFGHRISVVSGREEARLIYLGVASTVAPAPARRLVVDIGGGSTECIIGHGFDVQQADSLQMGCVSFSIRFFPGGELSTERYRQAVLAARVELESIETRYRGEGWDVAYGSSGTILAVSDILRALGVSDGRITAAGLARVERAVLGQTRVASLELPGLKPERASVIPGGLAILRAAFDAFDLDQLFVTTGAMREGALFDLFGRRHDGDARESTIERFAEGYQVDRRQAERVERTALALLDQVARPWNIEQAFLRQLTSWAARLHEVGLALSYSGYHKHGQYLLANSDLPGFSRDEQELLGTFVRYHRRPLEKPWLKALAAQDNGRGILRALVLLRLAVLLNRSRPVELPPLPALTPSSSGLRVAFPPGWLDAHPLTREDLGEEARELSPAGVTLAFE
jgi:exopolyphosphatase/guanosine-5'-triphosphate,3'-diphosphate pyrophosphatase